MLVVTRRLRTDEHLILYRPGTNEVLAKIRLMSRSGNKVKLGVEAPKNVAILRNEVFDSLSGQTKRTKKA